MKRKKINDIPIWANIYVFGSAVFSLTPNDLDLLVVYDPELCPPNEARNRAEILAAKLTSHSGLQPHVVVLTKAEEQNVNFIHNEQAVEFCRWQEIGNDKNKII